jgi:anti-sigma B factor antagonist
MSFIVEELRPNQVYLIKCPKRIDINNSTELRDLISTLIEQDKFKIVIDLAQTHYIDSSGLGAILSRIAAARSSKGDVRLAAPRKNVTDLLELTHLDQILKIYDNTQSATVSFQ